MLEQDQLNLRHLWFGPKHTCLDISQVNGFIDNANVSWLVWRIIVKRLSRSWTRMERDSQKRLRELKKVLWGCSFWTQCICVCNVCACCPASMCGPECHIQPLCVGSALVMSALPCSKLSDLLIHPLTHISSARISCIKVLRVAHRQKTDDCPKVSRSKSELFSFDLSQSFVFLSCVILNFTC